MTWILLAIVIIGSVVRFAGILWGLPFQLHADEWVVVEGAIDMAQRNSFEPPFFYRPDHLEMQLSYVVYEVWSHLFAGAPPEVVFAIDPAPFYALSRAIIALLGSAMIPVGYLIGRAYSRIAGIYMAATVAFFPPFVEHSRYATPDIPLALACMIAILGCVTYMRTQSWYALALASFGVAWGTTAKYPALLAAVAIAVAVIVSAIRSRHPWQIVTRGAASLAMVFGMIFVLSPVLFTNSTEVRAQLFQQNSTGHLGADGLDWSGNMAFYAQDFAFSGGYILIAFAAAGVGWCIWRRRWDSLPLLTGVVFWVAISVLSLHWDRWGLPMYVTPVLLAGLGLHGAWDATALLTRRRGAARWTLGALAGVAGGALMIGALSQVAVALAPDTRVVSAKDLDDQGITSDDAFYDGYTPFLPDGPKTLAEELTLVDGVITPLPGVPDRDYVLTSSSMVNRLIDNDAMPDARDLYRAIPATLDGVRSWDSVGSPPESVWAPATLLGNAVFIGRVLSGGMSGPQIVLYGFPN